MFVKSYVKWVDFNLYEYLSDFNFAEICLIRLDTAASLFLKEEQLFIQIYEYVLAWKDVEIQI